MRGVFAVKLGDDRLAVVNAGPRQERRALGIIGCGAVVQTYYTKVLPLVAFPGERLVFDTNESAARRAAYALKASIASMDQILTRCGTVIIATPPSTHYQLIKTCLELGINVVSEKPFVGKRVQACELLELAVTREATLHIAHLRRYYPSVQLARSIIMSEVLGRVVRLAVVEGNRFSWQVQTAYVTSDSMGGVVFDTGSHALDMALYAARLDDVECFMNVRRVVRDRPEPSHTIDAEFSVSTTGGEIPGRLRLSRFASLANRIRIYAESGYVEFSTDLRNSLRLGGPSGSSVVYALQRYTDPMQCFLIQYRDLFLGRAYALEGRHFVNLTALLETIAGYVDGTSNG
jgi:predicted dehydrogenase